jgi:hypothetical protein
MFSMLENIGAAKRWLPVFATGLRIRIGSRSNDFGDPDQDWESRSRMRIQGPKNFKKCTYIVVNFISFFLTERYY